LIPAKKIVNNFANKIAYHYGHYRDTKNRHLRKLCRATARCEINSRAATALDFFYRSVIGPGRKLSERVFKEHQYPWRLWLP
jgi:hypothetical protein